jgi:hypothetical protein
VNTQAIYKALQDQLAANLKGARSVMGHPGSKGEATETNWIAMLEAHLPKRYSVSNAFVMDCDGICSDQLDVVIYDRQYTPALYNNSGQIFLPAESVYSVFEVKQTLNKFYIEYAGHKAASVRKLRRTAANIVHAGGVSRPRPLTPILAGILTYKSEWRPPFGKKFEQALSERPPHERLDLGCAVAAGSFEAEYPTDSEPRFKTVDSSFALMSFFLTLLKRLQGFGTISAVDYDKYLGNLARGNPGTGKLMRSTRRRP